VRRGINWDKLEVQLHGFVAAARRSWEGGWKGASERACNATLIAATKKLTGDTKVAFRSIKKYFPFFVAIKNYFISFCAIKKLFSCNKK
jgi:hypothetical protein